MVSQREEITEWLKGLQDKICAALETSDGAARFSEDAWTRKEGGGGRTRIIRDGAVFEKGGVLFSAVHGDTPAFLLTNREHSAGNTAASQSGSQFYATGVSIVIHPVNPFVPIIHMNIRYFEMDGGVRWLGGGIDLTPHYVDENDARYFHEQLRTMCNRHHGDYYSKFRKWADDYFYIPHRQETRGIGGIFFDRLNSGDDMDFEKNLLFWNDVGNLFAPLYTELVQRNRKTAYSETNRQWQLLRRGRYVEFNLLYDKGTKFGLETNGRVESILMSLPKLAGWEYNFIPEKDSAEEKTLRLLRKDAGW